MPEIIFKKRQSVKQVEEATDFAPKFDANGLIPVVTTDFITGEVLMQGYMNEEALKQTIAIGEAVYYSRSRQKLWHKGKTSGFVQKIKEMRIDDDQDCVWLRVNVMGGAPVSIAAFLLVRNGHLPTQLWNLRKKKKYLIQKRSMEIHPTQQSYKIVKKIYNFV